MNETKEYSTKNLSALTMLQLIHISCKLNFFFGLYRKEKSTLSAIYIFLEFTST